MARPPYHKLRETDWQPLRWGYRSVQPDALATGLR